MKGYNGKYYFENANKALEVFKELYIEGLESRRALLKSILNNECGEVLKDGLETKEEIEAKIAYRMLNIFNVDTSNVLLDKRVRELLDEVYELERKIMNE